MITIRKSSERGHADHGWLNSYHSFSFADYYDEKHIHFGPLRVINEDRVEGGSGFGTHSHRDMEIVSYVLKGALAHKDSMGNHSVSRPGDVQRMTAGTGVTHSEFNNDKGETHFLQIWIIPRETGLTPSYEQKFFANKDKQGTLRLVASPDGRDDSVVVHQDVCLYAGRFDGSQSAEVAIAQGRLVYVHVVCGEITINGKALEGGDAMLFTDEPAVRIEHGKAAEVLVFDLPSFK